LITANFIVIETFTMVTFTFPDPCKVDITQILAYALRNYTLRNTHYALRNYTIKKTHLNYKNSVSPNLMKIHINMSRKSYIPDPLKVPSILMNLVRSWEGLHPPSIRKSSHYPERLELPFLSCAQDIARC